MSVVRSIPLFSITTWACYSVGTGTVGGLPNLSTWSQCKPLCCATEKLKAIDRPDLCASGLL